MDIEFYSFKDENGNESGFTTQDADKAREYAKKNNLKWIANIFEFVESELVEDFTLNNKK